MKEFLIKYFHFICYFLNNKQNSIIETNLEPLNRYSAITLQAAKQKAAPWTIILYPNIDTFAPFFIVTQVPVTLLLDYDPNLDLKTLLDIYGERYDIANVILLNEDNDKGVYNLKRKISNAIKICVTALDREMSRKVKSKYDPEKILVCRILGFSKVQNIWVVSFYLILAVFLIILYFTLRVYMTVRRNKNPVITDLELCTCPIMRYREITDKIFEECLICMDTYLSEDYVRTLHCQHYYHKKCIDPWLLNKSAQCPYCRTLIKVDI